MGLGGHLSYETGGVLREQGKDRKWMVTDCEAGDVFFHILSSRMIHGALKNEDEKGMVRWETDLRLSETELSWMKGGWKCSIMERVCNVWYGIDDSRIVLSTFECKPRVHAISASTVTFYLTWICESMSRCSPAWNRKVSHHWLNMFWDHLKISKTVNFPNFLLRTSTISNFNNSKYGHGLWHVCGSKT